MASARRLPQRTFPLSLAAIFCLTIFSSMPAVACADPCSKSSSSRGERDSKNIELLLGLSGTSVGLYMGRDTVLEGRYSGLDESEDEGLWRDTAAVRLKRFHSNSFYSALGFEWDRTGDMMEPGREAFQGDGYGVISVGNQWQWSVFTMGVDWASAGVNLAKLRTRGRDVEDDVFNRERRISYPNTEGVNPIKWRFAQVFVGAAF